MFTPEQRDQIRHRILELAKNDPRVTAGALTGSTAFGSGDKWSDIDIAFGIIDSISPETILNDWTQVLNRELNVIDHFDLPSGSSIYRVFLLPTGLEIDIAITPAQDFGPRGPNFHTLFGPSQQLQASPPPNPSYLIGLSWHHILHARSSIER